MMGPSPNSTSEIEFEQLLAAASHATVKSPKLVLERPSVNQAVEENKGVPTNREKTQ
jgi:hypothetical protein